MLSLISSPRLEWCANVLARLGIGLGLRTRIADELHRRWTLEWVLEEAREHAEWWA